jgi:pyruvate,orthophosphate dikinase
MKKLILNFKSKDSNKIKIPKNFLGGKGANLSEMLLKRKFQKNLVI